MDETIMSTVEEQTTAVDTESVEVDTQNNDEKLKVAIEDQLKKIQRQNMLLGAQTFARIVLQKIEVAMRKPGKRTMNDYKRLIKDIEKFCAVGISRTINADGETEPVAEDPIVTNEETVQN